MALTQPNTPSVARSADSFWSGVAPAWQECFLLAWESFRYRSVPVGAVLVDPTGAIVARGRNRRGETAGPAGCVAGSNIAHAEVNALATLPPGEYADHVLYTTLEPCFLCTAALRYSHVGTVRYAAADPMWSGMEELPRLNRHLARRWTRREGPVGGPLQTLAAVLPLVSAMERVSRSVLECHEQTTPEVLRLAERLAGARVDDLRTMTLVDALGTLWSELTHR